MLEGISWSDYITSCAVVISGYYVVIAGLFYRRDIQLRMQRPVTQTARKPMDNATGANAAADVLLMPRAHECVDEVSALLEQLGHEQPTELFITDALQRLLVKYADLKGTSFQSSITRFIGEQAEIQCATAISEANIGQLWSA